MQDWLLSQRANLSLVSIFSVCLLRSCWVSFSPFCLCFFLTLLMGGLLIWTVRNVGIVFFWLDCDIVFCGSKLRANCSIFLYIESPITTPSQIHTNIFFLLHVKPSIFLFFFLLHCLTERGPSTVQNVPAALLSAVKDRKRLLYLLFTLTFNRGIGSELQNNVYCP